MSWIWRAVPESSQVIYTSAPITFQKLETTQLATVRQTLWLCPPACNKRPLAMLYSHQTIKISTTPQASILRKIQQTYSENSPLAPANVETPQINVANMPQSSRLGGDNYLQSKPPLSSKHRANQIASNSRPGIGGLAVSKAEDCAFGGMRCWAVASVSF